jgi:hypothetical protein
MFSKAVPGINALFYSSKRIPPSLIVSRHWNDFRYQEMPASSPSARTIKRFIEQFILTSDPDFDECVGMPDQQVMLPVVCATFTGGCLYYRLVMNKC